MDIFNINKIIDNKSYILKEKEYSLVKLEKEFIVDTSVELNYLNEKIINLRFTLVNSYIKKTIIYISYNYSTHNIDNATCDLCLKPYSINNFKNCYHVVYLLKSYNEGKIDGCLDKFNIDEMFNSLYQNKQKEIDSKRTKEMNKLLNILEQDLNNNIFVSSAKLVEILPNIDCFYTKGMDYETYLNLKIGVDKYYVIKDIREFLGRVDRREIYSYGKSLKFKHAINNFDASSQKCIEILMNFSIDSYWNDVRNKEISPMANQAIIEAYKGKKIFINGCENLVCLDDFEPIIAIKNGKIMLENGENIEFLPGYNYDFIVKNGAIYRLKCDSEIRILTKFLMQNSDFDSSLIKKDFAQKIVSRFVDYIELDDDFKDEFSIKELTIHAYFDYIDDEILLDAKYYLDDDEIDEKSVIDNNFISKKYSHFCSIINSLGFTKNKISDINLIGNFLTSDLQILQKHCEIFLSDNIKKMTIKRMNKIKSNISYNSGMLDVCFENLNFSNEELSKILKGIKKKVKYVKLSKNIIFDINNDEVKQFFELVEEFNLDQNNLTGKQSIPLYQGLKLMSNDHDFKNVNIDENIKNMIKEISNYKEANYEIPSEVKGVLRRYQINAFNWLKTLVKYNFCGILADDMGLGKTLEIISLILSENSNKPSLIVGPKSLIFNWQKEFEKWAPNVKVVVINGVAEDRKNIILSIKNDEKVIFISSYDSLRNDLELYNNVSFRFCILDEAQFIKNHNTLKAQSVKQIKSEIRFVLTGTPIENTVVDLWSLFDFLMPNYLYNYNKFKDDYEKEIITNHNSSAIKKLVKKITPFILRRTKAEVLNDLPEKIEVIRYAQMNDDQRKVYEAQLLKTKEMIDGKSKVELLSAITRLRQICVYPKMFMDNYQGESAKVDLLMELLLDMTSNGHKVLVFSQFTSVFDAITNKLSEKGIGYFVLTGKTPAMIRVNMVEQFNERNSIQKVFLISLKAGGTGLNLVGADTVIQLDPWWNVAAENQASDRAHRIGQKNVVQVIKLICENSIEQKVLELQELKKDIVSEIIADNDENISKLNSSDLKYLLS